VRCGVDAYRVVYRTIDPHAAPTLASSLLAAPRCADAGTLKQVAWLHGTTVYKDDAASISEDSDDRATAFAFAAAGYLTTAPDYLGLGVGPGTHPYDDRPSEVTASLDALRATRTLATWLGVRLDPHVAVSGFSQGAAAALALARALQEGADAHLRLAALAPMSGPYDMSGTLAAALSGDVELAPAYLAYLTVAWNRLHHLYDSPSEAFLPPYDQTVDALFDNTHPPEEALTSLPETLEELFTPQFLEQLAHPSGNLLAALEVGDSVCDFQPAVVTHLYAASGDRDTPIANALGCQMKLESNRARVELTDFGNLDHSGSLAPALTLAIQQFGSAETEH
jgi:acetyl esterase/lipase